ncbi:MAG: hypothetical protein MUP70_05315, partial [Candidatus Aminicenantes bacterium]|nr:hypothetical protein [Candidatus Aminicenantes bacterium]
MTAPSPRRPTAVDFFQSFNHILEEYDPHSVRYLNPQGIWNKNPESLQELAVHELLHHFRLMGAETRLEVTDFLFCLFNEGENWLLVKRFALKLLRQDEELFSLSEEDLDIGLRQSYSSVCFSGPRYPFVFLLHVLAWFLTREAQKINSEMPTPSWDRNAHQLKTLFKTRLDDSERFLNNDQEAAELEQIFSQIKNRQPLFGVILPERLAECGRITTCIEGFLEKCRIDGCPEEVYPLICEHLTPPMGIVTNTSPALLHPCLRLLIDRNVPVESGIPYQASVILSVLSDPRSTERLLQAFDFVPVHFSKIRENILYTLGNLAEKDAVAPIIEVLNEADEVSDGAGSNHLITGQKQEALWAAGKIGLPTLAAVSVLQEYATHTSAKLRTCLAWTLGELGKAQKMALNGISVDIITSLLQLMKTEDRPVFEESIVALKKIGMPDFLHALYFYHIGAV